METVTPASSTCGASSGLLVPAGTTKDGSKMYGNLTASSAMVSREPYAGSIAPWRTDSARRSSMPCTWSACACVNSTASIRSMPAATSWSRSSGGVSIRSRLPLVSMSAAVRVRLSRGSEDVQVGQRQPICGTPNDVPVPRKISRTSHLLDLDEVGAARNVPRHSRRHHDAVALLREPAFENEIAHHLQHGVVPRHVVDEDGNDAPHERELAIRRRLGRHRQNRHRRPERGDFARGEPALGECDDERRLQHARDREDRKSTRLNSSHLVISYAVFCLKKKKNNKKES